METNDHSMIKLFKYRHLVLAFFSAVLLCSCGETDPNQKATIYWNETKDVYLHEKEVEHAPSGELRIKKSGEYLSKNEWHQKDLLESEIQKLRHYEE